MMCLISGPYCWPVPVVGGEKLRLQHRIALALPSADSSLSWEQTVFIITRTSAPLGPLCRNVLTSRVSCIKLVYLAMPILCPFLLHACISILEPVQVSLLTWDCGHPPLSSPQDLDGAWLRDGPHEQSKFLLEQCSLRPWLLCYLRLQPFPGTSASACPPWVVSSGSDSLAHVLEWLAYLILFLAVIKSKVTDGLSLNFLKFLPHQIIISWWSPLSSEHSLTSSPLAYFLNYTPVQKELLFTTSSSKLSWFHQQMVVWLGHNFAMPGALILCKLVQMVMPNLFSRTLN